MCFTADQPAQCMTCLVQAIVYRYTNILLMKEQMMAKQVINSIPGIEVLMDKCISQRNLISWKNVSRTRKKIIKEFIRCERNCFLLDMYIQVG